MMAELELQEKIARARREIDNLEEQLSQVQKGVTKDVSYGCISVWNLAVGVIIFFLDDSNGRWSRKATLHGGTGD